MRRRNLKPIGELLRLFCRQEGLETPLNEYRLIQSWPQLLGPTIAGYTKELYIKNQILYVHLTSSVLRHELMMNRKQLVIRLNEHVRAQVITEIILR